MNAVKRGQRKAFRRDDKERRRRRITVDDLLSACSPQVCKFNHDHYDDDGLPLLCNDCSGPIHYNYDAEEYEHDDPYAPACFLIGDAF